MRINTVIGIVSLLNIIIVSLVDAAHKIHKYIKLSIFTPIVSGADIKPNY
jgi:hypothetical protein